MPARVNYEEELVSLMRSSMACEAWQVTRLQTPPDLPG